MDIPREIDKEEAVVLMREAAKISKGDPEAGHGYADDILLARLRALGEDDLIAAFGTVDCWYA